MSKTIRLGNRLRYPITIVKLLKKPGDVVKQQEPVMQYSFKWIKTVGDSVRDETWDEEQTSIVDWNSPSDGDLKQWLVKEGQRVEMDGPCFVVKEACSHDIQFQGLCAICGKDMTEVSWAAEERDTARAPISMTHDLTNLTVSADQARRTENTLQERLLQSRKLSLVVDLDQTIIHACVDETVGEWQKDPSNPNYESVKNVKSFQLDDGPAGVARSYWYYIKMRPGLEGFLKRVAEMYELHVYTMGTRAYAQSVARIVDPDQKLFGNRIISRDENQSIIAKSLQRLFPVSTNMVVIIDDRSDVWPRNRHNLIKVSPYDFFKGIGDINSSFLPKRKDILPPAKPDEPVLNGNAIAKAAKVAPAEKTVEEISEDTPVTKAQLEEQERELEKQKEDRPLQLLQEKQDKEDEEAAEKATVHSEDGDDTPPSSPPHQRHQVLRDDDTELEYLEQHLTQLHKTYFEEYERQRKAQNGNADIASIPDVGPLLDTLKSRALRGVKVVLTGIIPNEISVERSEIGQQLISFGATIHNRVSSSVTHVVVNPQRLMTEKLKQALRIPTIKIVNPEWLVACFSQWAAVDEAPYLVHVDVSNWPARQSNRNSDAEDTDDGTQRKRKNKTLRLKPKLNLVSESGEAQELDEDSDDEGDSDFDDEDDESLLPGALEDGQLSPVDGLKTFNWGSADAELDEFLASGSDDDEEEEEEKEDGEAQETEGGTEDEPTPSRKRKFEGEEGDTEGEGGTDSERGSTAGEDGPRPRSQTKKLRRTQSVRGTSSLRNQYVSDADVDGDGDSSLPTPQVTGDEEDIKLTDLDEAQLEAELEAELMAEFEAAPDPVEVDKG